MRLKIRENVPAEEITTIGIGGVCRFLVDVEDPELLGTALAYARERSLPTVYFGDGSNVLIDDRGFPGIVIRNRLRGISRQGKRLRVGSGESLCRLVQRANQEQLAGMERLYGIPGTLAGAIVGNAGAYGQEICDNLIGVTVWREGELLSLPQSDLAFEYRTSILKKERDWFVTDCSLELEPTRTNLVQVSGEIMKKRLEKYPEGMKCPGSFFKNIPVSELSSETLNAIPDSFIHFGKVPAGRLLEAVGANGTRRGEAEIASYHGNLFVNRGRASSEDVLWLAREFALRVQERFRVKLVPEILILSPSGENTYSEGFQSDC